MEQYWVILILALAGWAVAFFINHKKVNQEKLVCLIGQDCNKVVNSRYASTFGIDNQVLGMIYYALVAIFAATLLVGFIWPETILFIFKIATVGAAIFSVYLIFVQAFVLREWCEWCLGSALITLLIGLISFF